MENNNEEFENIPEAIDNSNVEPQNTVAPTEQKKPSDQLAKLSLVLGIIGSGLSFGAGFIFLAMFFLIIGFGLVQSIEYILLFSATAAVSIILGIASIVLASIKLRYHKALSIIGIISGIFSIILGALALYIYITAHIAM